MAERELVTIRTIDDVSPIEGADRIEVAKIGGWQVVVGKGEFSAGDEVLYFEIDSALPLDDPRFTFLGARSSRSIEKKAYHVLRTIRLRGVYSQGLIMPTDPFELDIMSADVHQLPIEEAIGVIKYEPPVPANLGGHVEGSFFQGVQKTDAERVQNISPRNWEQIVNDFTWKATLKIDGTSFTGYNDPEEGFRVCSRNWELARSEGNAYWEVVDKFNLEEIVPKNWIVQGEVYGPGIQGNPQKAKELSFGVFRVLNQYGADASEWPDELYKLSVPVLDLELPATIEEAIEQVNGLKYNGILAEGVVWNEVYDRVPHGLNRPIFKVISNKYLSKEKD